MLRLEDGLAKNPSEHTDSSTVLDAQAANANRGLCAIVGETEEKEGN